MNIQNAGLWRSCRKLLITITSVGFAVSLLVAALVTIAPQPQASAAIPSDSQLEKQGMASAECKRAAGMGPSYDREDQAALKSCAKAYIAGYKNPNANKATQDKYCDDNYAPATKNRCRLGYPKGQADRKQYDKDQSQPKPTGNLTDKQIRALAEQFPVCAETKPTNERTFSYQAELRMYEACIQGYTAGYKGLPQPDTGNCGTYENHCKRGFDGGKAMKAQNISTASEQASASGAAASARDEDEDNPIDPCDELGRLAWIVCPVAKGVVTAIDKLDNGINDLLTIGTERIFCTAEGPECTEAEAATGSAYKTAWNSFRIFSLAMVVIAALIVIIANAFGYEILDAYTIRKVLPRILIAVIFIVLSWEVLEFLIMLSNDAGNGIRALIYAPFRDVGDAGLSAGTGFLANGLLVGGLLALGPMGLLSFAVTALLAVLIAFLVLILRELIIIFLVLIAPLGIACLILPNTRKAWQLWQTTLTAMLVAFPIIAAMIAAGRVFAITTANSGEGIITEVISFSAYLLPYFMLPFAFRMAGGMLATLGGFVNDRGRGTFDRLKKYRQKEYASHGGRRVEGVNRRVMGKRADINTAMLARASRSNSRLARGAIRGAAGALAGYNLEAQQSAKRAEVAKEIKDQIDTGRDEEVRGLTVNKAWAMKQRDKDGNLTHFRTTADGTRQYKSLGGGWVDEAYVDNAHKRWGNDSFAQQAALSYEMRKALTEEDSQNLATGYAAVAQQWGMSENQATGAWIGAAFENQNTHLAYKHTDWKTGKVNGAKLAQEIYEKRGSYQMSQMHANTFEQLKGTYSEAKAKYDASGGTDSEAKKTMEHVTAVAETFMSRYGAGPGEMVGTGDEVHPSTDADGRRAPSYQSNAQGAAHVAERVRELAELTGVYDKNPPPNIPPQH